MVITLGTVEPAMDDLATRSLLARSLHHKDRDRVHYRLTPQGSDALLKFLETSPPLTEDHLEYRTILLQEKRHQCSSQRAVPAEPCRMSEAVADRAAPNATEDAVGPTSPDNTTRQCSGEFVFSRRKRLVREEMALILALRGESFTSFGQIRSRLQNSSFEIVESAIGHHIIRLIRCNVIQRENISQPNKSLQYRYSLTDHGVLACAFIAKNHPDLYAALNSDNMGGQRPPEATPCQTTPPPPSP